MKLRDTLLVAITMFIVASCGSNSTPQNKPQGYKLMKIEPQNIELESRYSASIRGRQDIKIIPRIDGYLTELYIKEGDKVKMGQNLFKIDQAPYIAQAQAAKAKTEVCKANVAIAELNYAGKKALYEKKVVSEFELKSTHNTLKMAQAELEQAKAEEAFAQNNLSYTVIKSPSDGVVGKIHYRKGDYVGASTQDGLTVVSDNSQMYVYFSMTESQVMDMAVQYGDMKTAISKMPDIKLQLSNRTVYGENGRVESVSGIVESSTGAVSIRALFPNKGGYLLSGGAGNIIIPYSKDGVIVIPQEATFEVQDKVYVYKIIDGVAKSSLVDVNKITNGTHYIVTGGLEVGDIIVAEGAGLVQEGTTIKAEK